MSSERDIDDILESLNQLLREGESHNDDHVGPDEEAEDWPQGQEGLDSAVEMIEGELDRLDDEQPEHDDAAATSSESNMQEASQGSTEPVELDQSSSDEVFEPRREEGEDNDPVDVAADGPVTIQRVVLTEEMLLDNPQGNLLSLVKSPGDESLADESRADEGRAEEHVEEHEALTSEEKPEPSSEREPDEPPSDALLEQVTADVINQLQETLPLLIKQSLERHLVLLKQASDRSEDKNRDE